MESEEYMLAALELAKKAGEQGEVPVGCVITDKAGSIIARGYNMRENDLNALAHAEIIAINQACKSLGSWRLSECSMYVTLEPCPMCAGAIINSRIANVYYGARDETMGACGGVINLFMERFGFSPRLIGGVLERECGDILSSFFKSLRQSREST